ncbi:hypothetical protein [Bacillus marinisedimentorum]|uniref:hypothetical protein n=1 Tax=Bacillus marinisedimentorum TaxID=1821260 RepID=UPI000B172FC5|nr:hypothetical protein [Bacillus marinisedimentorum]
MKKAGGCGNEIAGWRALEAQFTSSHSFILAAFLYINKISSPILLLIWTAVWSGIFCFLPED